MNDGVQVAATEPVSARRVLQRASPESTDVLGVVFLLYASGWLVFTLVCGVYSMYGMGGGTHTHRQAVRSDGVSGAWSTVKVY